MSAFETIDLAGAPVVPAPDGSTVHVLLKLAAGGMAYFELGPGRTSRAVRHGTVEEIWYVIHGTGQMWRSAAGRSETVNLDTGTCLTIPVGTSFQFRTAGMAPLEAIGVTMPNWPGDEEAEFVDGCPDW